MADFATGEGENPPYFAYGTLLGASAMRAHYPSAESLGLAFLDGHDLSFARYGVATEGGCTIVERQDGILFGVLYRLSAQDMERLLAVGGLAHWYERRTLDVTRVSGGRMRAVTLRVDGDRGPWAPPEAYARLVTDGAVEAKLPDEYRTRLGAIVAKARSAQAAQSQA